MVPHYLGTESIQSSICDGFVQSQIRDIKKFSHKSATNINCDEGFSDGKNRSLIRRKRPFAKEFLWLATDFSVGKEPSPCSGTFIISIFL